MPSEKVCNFYQKEIVGFLFSCCILVNFSCRFCGNVSTRVKQLHVLLGLHMCFSQVAKHQLCKARFVLKIFLYTVYKKKCPEYKISSKLDNCKITDYQQQPTANIGSQFCFHMFHFVQIGKFVKCAGKIEFWSKLCTGNLKAICRQLRFAG